MTIRDEVKLRSVVGIMMASACSLSCNYSLKQCTCFLSMLIWLPPFLAGCDSSKDQSQVVASATSMAWGQFEEEQGARRRVYSETVRRVATDEEKKELHEQFAADIRSAAERAIEIAEF
ncbi:MAG: hypothetical protein U0892_10505 [Pirellulales bacterium]